MKNEEAVFDTHADRYEAWFERHRAAYVAELLAVRALVPYRGEGLEIGVGSGRFAGPLGVSVGVDPSPAMLRLAAARGISVVQGVAEQLPFTDAQFDYALVVTTLCFVESPRRMLREAHRVLKPGGRIIVGFIDRDSPLGQEYLAHQAQSVFYREATFYSTQEVEHLLVGAGFTIVEWVQTLALPLSETHEIEPLRPGHDEGAFVVVAAERGG